MTSYIFEGKLMHTRRDNVRHNFVYSVFMLVVDLDDLPTLDRDLKRFGHNRRSLVSIHDRDHLPHPDPAIGRSAGIKAMVLARLAEAGVEVGPDNKVYMLSNPRIFGYCFNPITVYYAYNAAGEWLGGVAEVNNTLGDQHPYILSEGTRLQSQNTEERRLDMRRFEAEKIFYVSPWIPMDACYELSMTPVGKKMIVHIDEYRQGERFFQARLWGDTEPLTQASLRRMLFRYPLMTFKVTAAIHWEGIKIQLKGGKFLRKRVAYRTMDRPSPYKTTPK